MARSKAEATGNDSPWDSLAHVARALIPILLLTLIAVLDLSANRVGT